MIFPLWQQFGQSSHLLALQCGEVLGERTTHTGTLDPMAEGVLVVLSGDDRFGKSLFSDWKKRYRFSVLWGVQTDTADRLGVILSTKMSSPDPEVLGLLCRSFPTEYDQRIPAFSARRWEGKSSFEWAREGSAVPEMRRTVRVDDLQVLRAGTITTEELLSQLRVSVVSLSGDFRQQLVLKSWQETLTDPQSVWLVTEHAATVSTGTYVRQLVQDLAENLETPALTWSITREENGPYSREDCVALDELREIATS